MPTRNSFGRDSVLTIAVIVASLLPFLLAPLRARLFGPDGRGEFAFFQSSFTIIAAASALGYRHAHYQRAHRQARPGSLLGRWGILATTAVGIVIGLPLVTVAFLQVGAPVGYGLLLASFAGPLFASTQLEVAEAQWQGNQGRVAALAGGPPAAEFVLNLVLFFSRSLTVATGIVVTLAAEALRIGTAIRSRVLRSKRLEATESLGDDPAPTAGDSTRLLKEAAVLAPALLAPLLASNIDAVIYGGLASTELLGFYAVSKIATSVLILAATTLEGRFLRLAHSRGVLWSSSVAVSLLLTLGALGTGVGHLVVPVLFGEAFRPSGSALPVTALAGVFGGLFVLLSARAAREGRGKSALHAAMACFAVVGLGCLSVSTGTSVTPTTMALPLVAAYAVACFSLIVVLIRNEKTP